ASIDRQRGKALRYVVVQFAREARTFLLLCMDERPAEFVRRGFGTTSSESLVKQPGNQCALQYNDGKKPQKFTVMLPPVRPCAEIDLAPRRQAVLPDAPALQFPPIKLRTCKLDGRPLDVSRLLASQDAHGHGGCLSAPLKHREHWATDKLAAEEGIVIGEDGRAGDGVKPCQCLVPLVHRTRRIDDHQLPENRGP